MTRKQLFLFFLGILGYFTCFSQIQGLPATLYLYTGEVLEDASTQLQFPDRQEPFVTLSGGQQVYLQEVKYIERPSGFYRIEPNGKSFQYDFYQREQEGARLSVYALRKTRSSSYPYKSSRRPRLEYFETENGTLQKVNYTNLSAVFPEGSPAQRELTKANKYRLFEGVSIGLGTLLIATALINSAQTQDAPDEYIIIAPLALIIPFAVKAPKQQHYRDAIDLYNR
jgi:hypothetical protein